MSGCCVCTSTPRWEHADPIRPAQSRPSVRDRPVEIPGAEHRPAGSCDHRTLFRSAVADKLIPEDTLQKVALPKVLRGEVRPPSLTEVRLLRDVAPERLRALVVLAAGSGLRSGELRGLTVDRVDFLRREVTVDHQLVYVPGAPPFFGPPRTPESVRVVPIPAFVVDALAGHLAAFPVAEDGLIFQADKGGPVLGSTMAGRWRQTVARAGLGGTVNLHHLRHGYSSVLNDGGVPFTTVMELLGRPSGCYLGDVHAPGQRLGPTGSECA